VTTMGTKNQDDQDARKGAIEGDRPTDKPQMGNPHGSGVDKDGLPNDPIATAEDEIGANEDESEGG
jgi:hypothetical protein